MTTVKSNPNRKELRSFGFILGTMTPAIFGLFLPWLFDHSFPRWPWIFCGVMLTWALILPKTLKPVYLVWMTIGQALGWVNTRIILSIMFYLIILPTGLIMRLAGKDPMARSLTKELESYRITSTVPDKKHVERPF